MNLNISRVKIAVTAPVENADAIRKALGDSGAGVIGKYTHCSISSNCIGTFKGSESSNPYIGTKHQLEQVSEIKIEVQCNVENVKSILKTLREVHPYEEPAIDIIPLIDENVFTDLNQAQKS